MSDDEKPETDGDDDGELPADDAQENTDAEPAAEAGERDDDARAAGDDDEEPAPAKKKKKKKRKRTRAGAGDENADDPVPASATSGSERTDVPGALDAEGRERPRFLLSFPSDPELDKLVAAFERGDFAAVRQGAPELANRAQNPEVRDAALELRQRLEPDPLIKYLLLASMMLLLVLVLHAYTHKP
ncbi:MAG: hypothetical protein IPI67_13945 [Myxococcales bacterium]|nr:hypothetical protein [Myxococcales bacterium]